MTARGTLQRRDHGWPTVTVAEIAERVAMGPFGSSIKVETFVPEGIPIISGQHLHRIKVNDSPGFNFITAEHAERLSNANVQPGDIVFTHAGNIGQVAYIPENSRFERYVVSQRQFYLRCDRTRAIPEFVTMYFRSRTGQHQLLANSSQVGVPSIAQPVSYLRTIEIPLPALHEQRAIARILGSLDAKIELNRRMNETLEAVAGTLFKAWFVDFDPVRAKIEGRDTGLPRELCKLFPEEMATTREAHVPEGWRVGLLADIASAPRRGTNPRDWPPETAYIGLEHMPRRSVALTEWGRTEAVTSDKSQFERGEILFGKLRPYFHKVGIAPVDGVCSTDIVVLKPKDTIWSGFLLACVSSEKFVDYTDQTSTGTKMPRTSWKSMSQYPICIPTDAVANAFNEATQPLVERILSSVHENHVLAAVRDALLPKLVSGEIRIKEAENATEAAA